MTVEDKKNEAAKVENTALLKEKLQDDNLGFTEEKEWTTLVEHVDVHKYLLEEKGQKFDSWEAAFDSWREKVYAPIFRVIEWWEVKKSFAEYTKGQLFFAVSTHWYYMLEKDPETEPEDAAVDFAAYWGKGLASWVSMMRSSAVMRAKTMGQFV
ncbi:MAG: hypothetical protein PQJ50_12370 [Spirochaetales bacterium]|nr:hypothetical protein [Spirochaetales bacterium]